MLVQLKASLSLAGQEGTETWQQWPVPRLASPVAPVTRPCSPQLQNNSSLPIKFSMQLDSLSSRSRDQHRLPQFLASPDQRTEVVGELASWRDRVGRGGGWTGGARRCRGIRTSLATLPPGTQNYSGQSVFSVVPVEGVMEPGKAQDFTVTFSPDHESLYFSDRLQVVLFEKAGLRPSLDPSSPPARPLVQALRLSERPHIGAWCLGGAPHQAGGHQVERPTSGVPQAHITAPPPPRAPHAGLQTAVLLPPESVPPHPPEGRGPRAHDVRGGRRPPGRARGVPDRDPCL